MTRRRLLHGAGNRLWQRMIARLACGSRLARPRAPLVLRRHRPVERSSVIPMPVVRPVENRTALHLHFTLPPAPVQAVRRRSTHAASAVSDRVQVTNLNIHQHLQRRALEQKILVDRPVLARWRSSLPTPPSGAFHRSGGSRVMRRGSRASSGEPTTAVPPRDAVTPRSVRRLAVPPDEPVRSPSAPRIAPVLRGDISVHARRHRAPTANGLAPAAPSAATNAVSPSRRRATPVTFVRPLTARAGGAPRPMNRRSVVTTRLRNVEHVTTRTNIVTRAVQPAVAQEVPAPRVLHRPQEEHVQQQAQPVADRVPAAAPLRPPAPPVLDVARLSDEVYRHIQRRVRIERERRGG